jgi:tetratricopeptide (TPR) repeat protein
MLEKIKTLLFGPPARRAEQSYELGMKELKRGRTFYAEHHFRTAVKLVSTSVKYRTAYGNVLMTKGDLNGAISEYEQALTLGGRAVPVLSNLGVVLRLAGKLERAVEIHKEAIEAAPNDPETLLNAALTFMQHLGASAALPLFKRLLEISPDSIDAHFHLASIEGIASSEQDFLCHLDAAIQAERYRVSALLMKGAYFATKGRTEEANRLIDEALTMDPEACSLIEIEEQFEPIRDLSEYKRFLSERKSRMYSCMTEANNSRESGDVSGSNKRHLVILAYGRHTSEAKRYAESALEQGGWLHFELSNFMPAEKAGLTGLGSSAQQGWTLAEEHGAHIFVF